MTESNKYFANNPNSNNGVNGVYKRTSSRTASEGQVERSYARYDGEADALTQHPERPSDGRGTNKIGTGPVNPRNTDKIAPEQNGANGSANPTGQPGGQPTGQRVLQGTLQAFSTSSLLSLLNIQKSTGNLRLRRGLAEGYIFVNNGEVYDAGLGATSGALAVFQLFGWNQGDFVFEVGAPLPNRRTIEASLPVLQVRATLWLDSMNRYSGAIPSPSHRIGVANEPRSEVVIEPYQWPVLTKIVSQALSITQLASDLNQDIISITRIAAELVNMGVALVYEPN